jgi:hypothetical protein
LRLVSPKKDNHAEIMRLAVICVMGLALILPAKGQNPDSGAELARLRAELQETRSQLADSVRQIDELRRSVEELRQQVAEGRGTDPQASPPAKPTAGDADKNIGFLAAKVDELHQDKVESGSKYPVKLSGLVLFNTYRDSGNVDLADVPSLAFPAPSGTGSLGASLRQTLLGIQATGPKLLGAQSFADLSIDFAGGSPTTPYGGTAGLIRLRTANLHLDWQNTSLTIGQDAPLMSPLSPTSYATLLEPALSWSGNLWVWTPQIKVERRLALNESSTLVFQGGVLDSLTEEEPEFQEIEASPGERTRVPAIAGRLALDRSAAAHYPFTIGFGGYRARQSYSSFPEVGSWTVNADFKARAGHWFELSGEWYRGQAVGGLGGGIWTSVIFPDPDEPHTAVQALRSTGGWAQLKFTPDLRYEFNAAIGQDENFGQDLRVFTSPFTVNGYPALKKNLTGFGNFIYRPNSVLLLALEFRHIVTTPAVGTSAGGSQVNLAVGAKF